MLSDLHRRVQLIITTTWTTVSSDSSSREGLMDWGSLCTYQLKHQSTENLKSDTCVITVSLTVKTFNIDSNKPSVVPICQNRSRLVLNWALRYTSDSGPSLFQINLEWEKLFLIAQKGSWLFQIGPNKAKYQKHKLVMKALFFLKAVVFSLKFSFLLLAMVPESKNQMWTNLTGIFIKRPPL